MISSPGFGTRLLAFFLDALIVRTPIYLLFLFTLTDLSRSGIILLTELLFATYLTLIAYFTKGRSFGKIICGIRIVNAYTYHPPTFMKLFIRNFLMYFAYIFSLSIALVVCIFAIIFRESKQGIHDSAASTMVVYELELNKRTNPSYPGTYEYYPEN